MIRLNLSFVNIRSVLVFVLSTVVIYCSGQSANEWIDYSKRYIKITDSRSGMFKLTYGELEAEGFDVEEDPSSFQLFKRGRQMAIEVVDGGDGTFDSGDYILFFGQKMDGSTDLEMYINQLEVTNPYYNLYTDSSSYFLTIGSSSSKRISLNSSVTTVSQDYIEQKKQEVLSSQYSKGDESLANVFLTEFDTGEGWMGNRTSKGSEIVFNSPDFSHFKDIVQVQPYLVTRFAGRNNLQHSVKLSVGEENTLNFNLPVFEGYRVQSDTIIWGEDQLKNAQLEVSALVDGSGAQDYISLVYADYFFARDLNLSSSGDLFFQSSNPVANNVHVDFSNVVSGTRFLDISDIWSVKELFSTDLSSNVRVELTELDEGSKSYHLFSPNNLKTPQKMTSVRFNDLVAADYILIYNSEFELEAKRLAFYRASVEGGGYSVLAIDQEQVINQFGFGERTPVCNRHFCQYMVDNYDSKFLLLFGNGCSADMSANGTYNRKTTFDLAPFENKDFVMTYGAPGSDLLFSVRAGSSGLVPSLATGRIPCYNLDEAEAYVDKVILHESIPYNDLWRKEILHMSGGLNDTEGIAFKNYMLALAPKAESRFLGGDVELFSKKTDDAVEYFNISEKVNNGVSLITYFGHSGPNVIEIDLGLVSEDLNGYRNEGKYPFLWINGCESTNVYSARPFRIRSRDWLITHKRGAIGVFGHASWGYTSTLNTYVNNFYELAFQDSTNFNLTVGEIQQKTIEKFSNGLESLVLYHSHSTQFNYLGDPAIKLFKPELPDYAIREQDVSISAINEFDDVIATSDSFRVNFSVQNLGRALDRSVSIKILRSKGGLVVDSTVLNFESPMYKDTFSIVFQNTKAFAGLNQFEIIIDPLNEQSELDESNNKVSFDYLIPLDGVTLLSPFNYEIVGEDIVDLVFQANEQFISDEISYEIQIDTSHDFSAADVIYVGGGTISHVADYDLSLFPDSTVFYWRVRNVDQLTSIWSTFSFTKIRDQKGWGQFSGKQLSENSLSEIMINSEDNKWYFEEVSSDLIANSAGVQIEEYWLHSNLTVNNQAVVLQGNRVRCAKNGLLIQVFDNETSLPYSPLGFGPSNGNCGEKPRVTRSFSNLSSEAVQNSLIDYLDLIPKNDAMLLFTIGNHQGTAWKDALKSKLSEFGMLLADSLKSDGQPYVLFGRKGSTTPIFEEYGDNDSTIITMDIPFIGNKESAVIRTSTIGPAFNWTNYQQNFTFNEYDSLMVSIYSVEEGGNKNLLLSFDQVADTSINLSNFFGSENDRNVLEIQASVFDSVGISPAQLQGWSVTFDKLPDLAFNPSLQGIAYYESKTFQQGEIARFVYPIHNTNGSAFTDSVSFTAKIRNISGLIELTQKLPPVAIGDTLFYKLEFPTDFLLGENQISFEVNSERLIEYSYDNNFISHSFDVVIDDGVPLLDVTFDGVYIEHKAVVSPNTLIQVWLVDENEYSFKSDTSNIYLFMSSCDTCDRRSIYFSEPGVKWVAATSETPFMIDVQMIDLEDGEYTLTVLGSDVANNLSSQKPQDFVFTVINEKAITHIYPIPNPFKDFCQFRFELTGTAIPDDITISVYSLTGSLVKTITSEDLGTMRVGDNTSNYRYYGTNDSGDLLANGLYYYKIEFDFGDTDLHYRETDFDSYENKVGKLMIVR